MSVSHNRFNAIGRKSTRETPTGVSRSRFNAINGRNIQEEIKHQESSNINDSAITDSSTDIPLQKPALTPADIAEEQYQYYQDNFVPTERGLGGQVRSQEEIEKLASNAGIAAGSGKGAGEFMRNTGRMGINLSQDQKEEFLGSYIKSTVGAKAGAKTRVRSGLYDQNIENLGNFVGLGRGLATSSQDAISDASANQTAVDNANKQAKAQGQAAMVSTVATVGMTVASIF